MAKKIEVEGGEIALENSNGDIAIIPKDKVKEVESMLEKEDFSGVDNLVSTLPLLSDLAEEGTVVPEKEEESEEEE